MVRRGGYGGLAAGAVGVGRALYKRAAKEAVKYVAKRRKTSGGTSGGPTVGITNQRDFKKMYKSKKRSRRSKAAGRFQKRVMRAVAKEVPSQIELMRGHIDATAAVNTQGYLACVLYGEAGNPAGVSDLGSGDIATLVGDSASMSTAATNKLQFKSAFLDLYITNTASDPLPNTLYLDIYTIYCRKDVYQYDGAAAAFNAMFGASVNLTSTTVLTGSVFGVTPFMNPLFCQHFKIGECTRVVLEPKQTYNCQMKDRKFRNYYFPNSNKVVCLKGYTKGYLIVYKGAAGYNQQDVTCNVAVEALRTYNYESIQHDAQAAGYINA